MTIEFTLNRGKVSLDMALNAQHVLRYSVDTRLTPCA